MVTRGRVDITVAFDNIYEADGWLRKEYRGFRKSALFVFRFNRVEDMNVALQKFENSFIVGDKLFIPMTDIFDRTFLDEAEVLVDNVKEFGGIVVEVEVVATKDANNVEELDDVFRDVRREIELWQFARAMDSLKKPRI
jgi:hypothetical protein